MAEGPVYKYKSGDRVVVVPTPRWESDKKYAGMFGTVQSDHWFNDGVSWAEGSGAVYRVRLDDSSKFIPLFEDDLFSVNTDQSRLDWHRAEVARLEKEISNAKKLDIPADLPVGSSIFFFKTLLVTKVGENKWHWFYVSPGEMEFHSVSGDKATAAEIKEAIAKDRGFRVYPADKD